MHIPRFFIEPEQIDEHLCHARIDDPDLVHQIVRVLRLGVGARVILLNGEGGLFHCRLEKQEKSSIELAIEKKETQEAHLAGHLTVAMPLIKPSRFEWALEKLTELGASTIIPLVTQRTVQKPSDIEDGKKQDGNARRTKPNVKKERWHAIVKEAAEQSERFAIPKVVAPQNFSEYLNDISRMRELNPGDLRYILAERKDCRPLSTLVYEQVANGGTDKPARNITMCIGPEGGFTEAELTEAAKAGLTFASLGKLILRSETAAVAAAAIVMAMRDL